MLAFQRFRNLLKPKQTRLCDLQVCVPVRLRSMVQSDAILKEVTVPLSNYKLHKLASGPPADANLTKIDAVDYYRQMKTIRCIEEAIWDLFKSNHVRGQSHLSTGQEACAVGMSAVLKPNDAISCSHRNHAWAFLKGLSPHQILAEITGRTTGSGKGKGGSMHLYNKQANFFGGAAIVGSQVPLGAGMALAMKSQGRGHISVAFYGEGAANQGQVFEAFNIAKLWDLPIIFVCENNGVARNAEVHRTTACIEFYTRGDYIPGILVNGTDLLTVREATSWAAQYCRAGYGPIVLEMDTAHLHGHAISGGNYKDLQISEDAAEEDPITQFLHQVLKAGLCIPDELQEIDEEIVSEIETAVEKARNDPEPHESETFTETCTEWPDKNEIRGCDAFSFHKTKL